MPSTIRPELFKIRQQDTISSLLDAFNLFRHALCHVNYEGFQGAHEVHFDESHSPGHALLEPEQVYLCFSEMPL